MEATTLMSVSFKRKRRARTMLEIAALPPASSLKSLLEKWKDSDIIIPKVKPKPKKRRRKRKTKQREAESQREKCNFADTRIGILLKYCCRAEFNVLTAMASELNVQISPELIEKVSHSSTSPIFKSRGFRIALLDFKVNGYTKFIGNVVDEEIKLIVSKLKERGLE